MYRYWDGTQWSSALSPTPAAPPPGRVDEQPVAGATGRRRAPVWPWVLGGVALILVLVVVAGFSLTRGGGLTPNLNPGGTGTTDPCPPQPTSLGTPSVQDVPGRVVGGPLSYPRLGEPWGAVDTSENRLAFGRDVAKQDVMVEPNYGGGGQSWVASLLVAELSAGDGFYSPQQGSEIVARCVVGAFYGDAAVQRDDVRNEALTVDGREAWVLESQLSFDIPDLRTKGELLIIVIVKIDDVRAGIYYASIPDTTPELVPDARRAMTELRVEE